VEPHVCRANWQTGNPNEEWVQIANGGIFAVALTGLEITDETRLQLNAHIYRFPPTEAGTLLELGMFESAIVYTGHGENRWHVDENGKRWLLLYIGRGAAIWNNAGDVVYLRKLNGQFVDSVTVGSPPRHPNGH
jgi:hypothetical protein